MAAFTAATVRPYARDGQRKTPFLHNRRCADDNLQPTRRGF
jgi:hypothetical protein